MWQFYYLLRMGQQDPLHVKGCVCLEDHRSDGFWARPSVTGTRIRLRHSA